VPYFYGSPHQFPVDHVLLPPYVTGVGPATHPTGRRLLRCDRVYFTPALSWVDLHGSRRYFFDDRWIYQVQPDDPIEVDVSPRSTQGLGRGTTSQAPATDMLSRCRRVTIGPYGV
jgi:hypothetical protein